jgi:CRP/FNR family nitrogen fixation transcriptional regulator
MSTPTTSTSIRTAPFPQICASSSRPLSGPFDMMGAPMVFARNCEIHGESEPADFVYQVVRGTVRTSKVLADGRRQISAFYFPGDVFGLEVGAEHTFSAEAITDSTVRVVRRTSLMNLAARDSSVASELWALTCRELARTQGHVLLLVKNSQERVVTFLFEMAARGMSDDTVELPMPRQDIADYLGLTIETVSRALTSLASDAAIELINSRRVVLRDRRALRELNA